jgi:uncharacterized protein (TIGR03435 family)
LAGQSAPAAPAPPAAPAAPAPPAAPAAPAAKFEVADVHASVPAENVPPALNTSVRIGVPRNGRYEIRRATIVDLIRTAYGVEADKVVGGPHWLEWNRYDVIARVPASASRETVMPMLQALLADRFGLVLQRELKPVKANAIVRGSGDLRLKDAATPGTCQQNLSSNAAAGTLTMTMNCRGTSIAALAEMLTRSPALAGVTGPVVDETGLPGSYDFELAFVPAVLAANTGGQTFAQALAAVGLKLEPKEVQLPTLTVERVNDTPTPNDAAAVAAAFPPQPPLEFDVADVRPSTPGAPRTGSQILPNGHIALNNIPLRTMINLAWTPPNAASIVGPRELDNPFDLIARVDSSGSNTIDQEIIGPMLQKLLTDELKLKVRWEEREVKGYSLVADGKHKLVKSDPAARTKCTSTTASSSSSSSSGVAGVAGISGIIQTLTCQNMTMGEFAAQLQRYGNYQIPVLDETGIEGRWDFKISFSPPGLAQALATARATAGVAAGAAPGAAGGVGMASDPTGEMTIEQAVDRQMGLKLRASQRPGRVLVVDYVPEKPANN